MWFLDHIALSSKSYTRRAFSRLTRAATIVARCENKLLATNIPHLFELFYWSVIQTQPIAQSYRPQILKEVTAQRMTNMIKLPGASVNGDDQTQLI
jgi:hypothetical protein